MRALQLFDEVTAARTRAREITEARDLASRGESLPLGDIGDVASSIGRVRKAAALDAPELVAVATTGRALARLRKQPEARRDPKDVGQWRRNGAGAQILADLGLGRLRVLGTPRRQVGLSGYGLEVVEYLQP